MRLSRCDASLALYIVWLFVEGLPANPIFHLREEGRSQRDLSTTSRSSEPSFSDAPLYGYRLQSYTHVVSLAPVPTLELTLPHLLPSIGR
jgi:hypothetical protein